MALRRRLSRGPGVREEWPERGDAPEVNEHEARYVLYARTSTKRRYRQRLQRQLNHLSRFVEEEGGSIVDTFSEVGQAEDETLPERVSAIDLARNENATLLVTYIDRFSRDTYFVRRWLRAGLRLQCVQYPHASDEDLERYAFQALLRQVENEENQALGRAEARQRRSPYGDDGTGLLTRRLNAKRRSKRVMIVVRHLQKNGFETLAAVADELNRIGVKTPSGRGRWAPAQVTRERITENLSNAQVEGDLGPVRFPPSVWGRVLPEIFESDEQAFAWIESQIPQTREN